MFGFDIQNRDTKSRARAGIIHTPHGDIETPAFIPVATKATVKSLTPDMVRSLGAEAILANTYHLYLQPGTKVLEEVGGLGKFMNWSRPTFTDSGGFQAFSLGADFGKRAGKVYLKNNYKITQTRPQGRTVLPEERSASEGRSCCPREGEEYVELNNFANFAVVDVDGVTFRSVLDGSKHRFTPEISIDIQHSIGADIIFAFDECLPPDASYEDQAKAVERTCIWAKRCSVQHRKNESFQALFGIVQGGRYEDLRRKSAKDIGGMDFDGFGIGGSFDKHDIATAVGWVTDELPENKPRHLLGIGEPLDLVLGIEQGIDTFDCVAPTRLGRSGAVYTKKQGRINIFNARFVNDLSSLDPFCKCYSCSNFTRAYIAHLFRAKEMLAATLVSIHNLYFLINITKQARQAILDGSFQKFKNKF